MSRTSLKKNIPHCCFFSYHITSYVLSKITRSYFLRQIYTDVRFLRRKIRITLSRFIDRTQGIRIREYWGEKNSLIIHPGHFTGFWLKRRCCGGNIHVATIDDGPVNGFIRCTATIVCDLLSMVRRSTCMCNAIHSFVGIQSTSRNGSKVRIKKKLLLCIEKISYTWTLLRSDSAIFCFFQ
jgi:hypothetical protein